MLLDRMPTECSPGFKAGLELYELAALGDAPHCVVEHRLRALNVMLTTDPKSVFDCIPLPAIGANGLALSIVIRDDIRRNLARSADDFDFSHTDLPAETGDSAQPS